MSKANRPIRAVLAAACLAAVGLAWPGEAAAKGPYLRGFNDTAIYSGSEGGRWLDETVRLGAGLIRVDVSWRAVTQNRKPVVATNPADPIYDFEALDSVVRAATSRGLRVMLTVYNAPEWAEGRDLPGGGGVWKPDPEAFGRFGEALARRYSGSFPDESGTLPRVRYFEAWNEPNLGYYLRPQWDGEEPAAARHYREMVNAFYDGVHAGNPGGKVVAGATAPYGEDRGVGDRTRPLYLLRELLCIRGRGARKLKRGSCSEPTKLDVLSHHPINLFEGPRYSARHADDASTADFDNVVRLLRFAERKGTIRPKGRRPAWATEIWWESEPPYDDDDKLDVPLRKHARWMEEANCSLWRQGADAVVWLQLVDTPLPKKDPSDAPTLQTGVFTAKGERKPAYRAFKFAFVPDRVSERKVRACVIAPSSGEVTIQRERRKGWSRVKSLKVHAGKPEQTSLRLKGSPTLRAKLADETSLEYSPGGDDKRRKRALLHRSDAAASASAAPSVVPEPLEPYIESP